MSNTYRGLAWTLNVPRLVLQNLSSRYARASLSGSVKLRSLAYPEIPPGTAWTRIRPLLSGICGSDLGLLRGESSPYLAPLVSYPMVLGHEVVGVVDEDGAALPKGTLVVVDPTLSCAARGLPLCLSCQRGDRDACENRNAPGIGPGLLLGYNRTLPGGWSTQMWVPSAQLLSVPQTLPTRRAVLTEPTAIVLEGLSRVNWEDVAHVLVLGAGTIGLLTVWLTAITKAPAMLAVRARHPHQQALAQLFGATTLYGSQGDREFVEREDLAAIAGDILPRQFGAWPFRTRGFDLVIDTVGSPVSLSQALSLTRPGGQLLLLGGAGKMALDMTPIWSRRLTLIGTFGYGPHLPPSNAFSRALHLLGDASHPVEKLVSHTVPLDQYREAFSLIADRRVPTIKVAFEPPS